MAFDYINEAFKRLDCLEEQMFDTSLDGMNSLSDFMDDDNTEDIVRVIDPEAEDETKLQDSYVGKVIVNCNVCHSHIFENKDEIKIEEEGSVNIEKQCPYCGEQEGFTIVGEIAPYTSEEDSQIDNDSEEEVESTTPAEEPIEEPAEETADLGESLVKDDENKPLRMSGVEHVSESTTDDDKLTEDFKEVSVTTEDQHMEMTSDENGKVTVTTEPVAVAEEQDTIVPVSSETEQEILDNNSVSEEEPLDEIEEVDFDFDDIDEEGMDELGEAYLRRVYENVTSFKTTSVAANSTSLIVEGLITFASGTKKKTGFIFEARDVNKKGKVRFSGSNKHLSESKDAFSLVGVVDNKKLFLESLKYNYKVDADSVRGIVRRK